MPVTTTRHEGLHDQIERHVEVSSANTALTAVTPVGKAAKKLHVMVKYSAAPTHAGITVTQNSGAGSAHDTQLDASAANAEDYDFQADILLGTDDTIDVLAPAGGVGITSAIAIYVDVIE